MVGCWLLPKKEEFEEWGLAEVSAAMSSLPPIIDPKRPPTAGLETGLDLAAAISDKNELRLAGEGD